MRELCLNPLQNHRVIVKVYGSVNVVSFFLGGLNSPFAGLWRNPVKKVTKRTYDQKPSNSIKFTFRTIASDSWLSLS